MPLRSEYITASIVLCDVAKRLGWFNAFHNAGQLLLDWPTSGGDPILEPPIGMLLHHESAPTNPGRDQTACSDFSVVNGFTERIAVIRQFSNWDWIVRIAGVHVRKSPCKTGYALRDALGLPVRNSPY
jgi:hypothetical protein